MRLCIAYTFARILEMFSLTLRRFSSYTTGVMGYINVPDPLKLQGVLATVEDRTFIRKAMKINQTSTDNLVALLDSIKDLPETEEGRGLIVKRFYERQAIDTILRNRLMNI